MASEQTEIILIIHSVKQLLLVAKCVRVSTKAPKVFKAFLNYSSHERNHMVLMNSVGHVVLTMLELKAESDQFC